MNKTCKALLGASLGIALAATTAFAQTITGAGASFPYPIYAKWSAAYKGTGGGALNYQSIGSGGGIAQIRAKTVTFGATDKPLTAKELQASGLMQFPTVIGGVVPVINVPGIRPGQLTLDGATLAAIFEGKIGRWNDPAIAKLNPGVNLPSRTISVVHRSDGSGTTFVLATYLSQVSQSWKDDIGADTAIDWPVGLGAKGNEGVAGNVAQIAGSIGYVEYAYAKTNRLAHVKLINRNGKAVEPGVESFRAAAQNTDWNAASKNNFYVLLTNQTGDAAWPIAATTYILMYRNPGDQQASANALKFFKWGFDQGDKLALDLDYVPLPDNAVSAITASWKSIQGSGM